MRSNKAVKVQNPAAGFCPSPLTFEHNNMIPRVISVIIAGIYIALAISENDEGAILKTIMFLVLPMACIWYGSAMGTYTGIVRGQYISKPSPGCLVAVCGWLMLLMPFLLKLIYKP